MERDVNLKVRTWSKQPLLKLELKVEIQQTKNYSIVCVIEFGCYSILSK